MTGNMTCACECVCVCVCVIVSEAQEYVKPLRRKCNNSRYRKGPLLSWVVSQDTQGSKFHMFFLYL